MALSLLHVYLSLCLSAIGLVVVQREEKHSERRRSQISGTVIERVHQVIGRDTPGYIDSNLLQSVAGDSGLGMVVGWAWWMVVGWAWWMVVGWAWWLAGHGGERMTGAFCLPSQAGTLSADDTRWLHL